MPDQWIRNWFLGGPATVDYSSEGQLSHAGRDRFVDDLRTVWTNVGANCQREATLVIRFGSIGDRPVHKPAELIAASFVGTGWRLADTKYAYNASRGRRQAESFCRDQNVPRDEVDIWASWLP
jgi:hypothetical protein